MKNQFEMKNRKSDPFAGFNFVIEFEGEGVVAGFHEVAGLSAEGEAGDINTSSAINVVLKRGLMRTDCLHAWRAADRKWPTCAAQNQPRLLRQKGQSKATLECHVCMA
jgi:hypothetical protein